MALDGYAVIDLDGHVFEPDSLWDEYLDPEVHVPPSPPAHRRPRHHPLRDRRPPDPARHRPRRVGPRGDHGGHHAPRRRHRPEGSARRHGRRGHRPGRALRRREPRLLRARRRRLRRSRCVARITTGSHDYCATDPTRLKGAAMLPVQSMPHALDEARRCVEELGFVSLTVPCCVGLRNPDAIRRTIPLYALAEELDVPIGFHAGGPRFAHDRFVDNYVQLHAIEFPFDIMFCVTNVLCGGVLERFKTLRVAMLEAGAGWAPFLIHRLDEHYEKRAGRDARHHDAAERVPRRRPAGHLVRGGARPRAHDRHAGPARRGLRVGLPALGRRVPRQRHPHRRTRRPEPRREAGRARRERPPHPLRLREAGSSVADPPPFPGMPLRHRAPDLRRTTRPRTACEGIQRRRAAGRRRGGDRRPADAATACRSSCTTAPCAAPLETPRRCGRSRRTTSAACGSRTTSGCRRSALALDALPAGLSLAIHVKVPRAIHPVLDEIRNHGADRARVDLVRARVGDEVHRRSSPGDRHLAAPAGMDPSRRPGAAGGGAPERGARRRNVLGLGDRGARRCRTRRRAAVHLVVPHARGRPRPGPRASTGSSRTGPIRFVPRLPRTDERGGPS